MTVPRRSLLTVVALLAAAVVGCSDPYADVRDNPDRTPTPTATSTPAGTAVPVPTSTPPPSGEQFATAPVATPELALRTFAEHWSNWTWRDPIPRPDLVRLATGRVHDALLLQGDDVDPGALERMQPAWKGRIEAISVKADQGARRAAVVVLREQQYQRGQRVLDGLHYSVYLAEVTRIDDGWAVSKWDQQP